jgi:hypothetical protein
MCVAMGSDTAVLPRGVVFVDGWDVAELVKRRASQPRKRCPFDPNLRHQIGIESRFFSP